METIDKLATPIGIFPYRYRSTMSVPSRPRGKLSSFTRYDTPGSSQERASSQSSPGRLCERQSRTRKGDGVHFFHKLMGGELASPRRVTTRAWSVSWRRLEGAGGGTEALWNK